MVKYLDNVFSRIWDHQDYFRTIKNYCRLFDQRPRFNHYFFFFAINCKF